VSAGSTIPEKIGFKVFRGRGCWYTGHPKCLSILGCFDQFAFPLFSFVRLEPPAALLEELLCCSVEAFAGLRLVFLLLLYLLESSLCDLLGFHQHLSSECPGLLHCEQVSVGFAVEVTKAL
jgi:hypothetical protein